MDLKRIADYLIAVITVIIVNAGVAHALTYDSIEHWTGEGENEAALVVDWKNDMDPGWRIWGYRWSGSEDLYLEEMMKDIIKEDTGFYMFYNPDEFTFGKPVHGLGVQLGESAFAVDPELVFDEHGIFSGQVDDVIEDRIAVNPEDYWEEGWFDGSWSLWDGGDGQSPRWAENWDGITGTLVTADSWHGFSWAPPYPEPAPPPVPEPSTMILLGLAGMLISIRRRLV